MAEIRRTNQQNSVQMNNNDPMLQNYTWEANGSTVSVTPAFVHANVMKGDQSFSLHDVIEFILYCRANKLDPIAKDCYPVKYKGRMSMLSSIASFEKRAEGFPEYDGMEFGLIVQAPDGEIIQRDGQFKLPQETIVGGWCKVYRKDRKFPTYVALNFSEYNTGREIWVQKPAVMITKCAEAMALRKAFPKQNANLYIREEMGEMETSQKEYQQPKAQNFQRQKPAEIEHNYVQDLQKVQEKQPEKDVVYTEPEQQEEDFGIDDNMFA